MKIVDRARLVSAALIVLLVAAGVVGMRSAGVLESLELGAYDWFLRLRTTADSPDPRVVLVTITDDDIARQGRWPLPDATLAALVDVLAGYGARAIGLDIYRDVPVAPGTDALDASLTRNRHVVVATKFPEGNAPGIAPPAVLRETAQVGFTDVVVDPGGIVRRGLLYLDAGGTPASALGLRLALLYLEREGVEPAAGPRGELRLGRTSIRPFESHDGGYVGADARGYQMLLDFHGGNAAFQTVTLSALFAGRVPVETIRDKVVLVGVAAEGVPDYFYTPFSRGLLAGQHVPGVALHAHVASQLLRTALEDVPPIAVLGDGLEAAWLVLWAALGGVLALGVRSPWRFSFLAIAGLVALAAVDFAAFVERWWLPLVPPAVAWAVSATVVTAYVSYQEAAQRSVLMQLFSTHVSREVAQTIWEQRREFLDGRRPRPQRLTATVLFTDLEGFTSLAESVPPAAFVEWLNEYIEAMAQQVIDHGGVINKYIGDAIMAIFGVPVARSTEAEAAADAAAAVRCALAMRARFAELNARWEAEGRPTTRMRVGIFTGPVIAGSLGSADRLEYTVIGDTVNTAARLESFDKEGSWTGPGDRCRILVGDTTLGYLGPEFLAEPVGEVPLKGKMEVVKIHRILGGPTSRTAGSS